MPVLISVVRECAVYIRDGEIVEKRCLRKRRFGVGDEEKQFLKQIS